MDGAMKKKPGTKQRPPSAGRRIIASLREAVEWADGKDVAVRVTTLEVPMIDVRATRKRLGLSQAAFAAKFGFQTATLKNWEQGRTRPDGPARVLLAVIAQHPDAVEDALRKAS
jgi:putative transcriptional regulator